MQHVVRNVVLDAADGVVKVVVPNAVTFVVGPVKDVVLVAVVLRDAVINVGLVNVVLVERKSVNAPNNSLIALFESISTNIYFNSDFVALTRVQKY